MLIIGKTGGGEVDIRRGYMGTLLSAQIFCKLETALKK